jgi:hypothetical protein
MRIEETLILGDKTFHVKQFPATKAVKIKMDLIKLINEKESFSKELPIDSSQKEGEDTLERIIKFVSTLNSEKVISIMKESAHKNDCVTDKNKSPVDIDEEFAGELFNLYKLFAIILVINYRDFFLQLVSGQLQKLLEEILGYIKK